MKKLPKFKPGDPITVFWRDTISDDAGWHYEKYDPDNCIKQSHCVTSGFFLAEEKDTLLISRSWRLLDGAIEGIMAFPLSVIRRIVKG